VNHRDTHGVLFWLPRVLAITFAAFISLFALDTFDTCAGVGQCALALAIHLIPTLVILVALAVSWRRNWLGAIVFCFLGVLWLAYTRGELPLGAYLPIAGPPLLIGLLFLLAHLMAARRGSAQQPA
jgi:hypothetical protein